MKIYQVEELVGISKKNIRFYEDKGLLSPERNPENGYRDYNLDDVHQLEKIKLLRMLSVPIEEIRLIQAKKLSFFESMNRQIARLEQEQRNAEKMKELCFKLKNETEDLSTLDAADYLSKFKKMENEGTEFMDIEKHDINHKKKSGATIAAAIFLSIMLLILIPIIIMIIQYSEARMILITAVLVNISIIAGVIVSLVQRYKEIDKGEEYEARKY